MIIEVNIQKAFGLKTNEFFFCKMIIECNLRMMDFITHRFQHCVIGVGYDSGLMEPVRTRYMGYGESHLIHDM